MPDTPTPGVPMSSARDKAEGPGHIWVTTNGAGVSVSATGSLRYLVGGWVSERDAARSRAVEYVRADVHASALLSSREAGRAEMRKEAAEFIRTERETIYSHHNGSPIGDCPRWDNGFEIAAAVEALALTPREEEAGWRPIVKPLEWEPRIGVDDVFDAHSPVGHFITSVSDDGRGHWFILGLTRSNYIGCSVEDAKAAAQADYEARILSALVLPNPPLPASINEKER